MAMSKDQMTLEISNYLSKVELLINGVGQQKYITGIIPGNGSIVYDAPTEFSYTASTHYIYSLVIDVKMNDPFVPVDPPVRQATAVIDFTIGVDGKVLFINNHTAPVTYYARISAPLVK